MEYLQQLLGTLQQAVDFVSSFTAYLLGDEAHPGAGEPENARETRNRSSHHNCEVDTTCYGDIPSGDHLEAFERPLTTKVSSPTREIQETAEALNVNGAQTAAFKPELPETPYKYKEDYEQKLSDSCQFLADTPQEKLTAVVIGGKQKKDLEELLVWDPERTSWNGEAQQKVREKVINTKWEPFRPLVGTKEHEDLGGTGGTTVGQEKELEKTFWTQEAHDWTSNGAQLLGDQQRRLEEAAWTGEFQHVELEETNKMADEQQVEAKKKEEEEEEEEGPPSSPPPPPPSPRAQQEEARKVEVEEVILEATLGEGETSRNQEEVVEEEEEVGRRYQWDPKGKVEETRGIIVGWEKDQKETLWNKEVQQGAPDWTQLVVEQERGLEEARVWTGGFQHGMLEEENKMAEGQHSETAQEELVEADDNQKWESNSMAMEEGIQETVVDESERNQEEVPEEEEKMGRSHQWGPKGEVEVEKEMTGRQEKKLEETLWNKVVPQEEPDWEQLVDEQQVGLERTGSSVEFQSGELEEADKMAKRQHLEAEKEHVEVIEEKEDVGDMVGGKEGVQKGIPSGEETEGDQQKVLEEEQRSHQWEPKEEAEVVGTTMALEGELEEIWMNKEVQQGKLDRNQLVKKQQRRLVKVVDEGLQDEIVEEVDKMVEGRQLGTAKDEEEEEEEELKAEEDHQREPNRLAVEEGIMECMLDKSETVGNQEEVLEEKAEVGRNHQWELKGEVEEERGITEKQERELEETLWNKEDQQRSPKWEQFIKEKQVELERTASSVAFQCEHLEEREEMVEKPCLEVEKEHAEEEEVVEEWKGMVDIVAGREQNQEAILSRGETKGDQQEDVKEEEMERSPQWKPKDEAEEVGETTVDQERELEGTRGNKEVQQGIPEMTQFVTEQQELEKVAAWTGGLQCGLLEVVDKMAEGHLLEAEQVEGEEVKADEYHQWDPDTATIKGIREGMLDEAETEEDYEEKPKGKKDLRIDQWEPEEAAVNVQEQYREPKETADNREGQYEKLAGPGENEGDQQEEPVRNGAEAKAEEQNEHTESVLEDDEGKESETLTEPSCLDKEVLANITGSQLRQLEEKQMCLQQGFMLSSTSLERVSLPGPRTFLVEVTPLDTSAQKERVLLRRKSSIRRAPSLKRPKTSMENLAQEANMTDPENTPPQPQPQLPSRPPLRNFGFGPMHPNMMAELQTRMRKPQ